MTPSNRIVRLTLTSLLCACSLGFVTSSALGSESESELARKMRQALSGELREPVRKSQPTSSRTARPSSAPRWQCGTWQELWQGRGAARDCEWR